MDYIISTLLAIAVSAFIVYLLANKVFSISLKFKSLLSCAACAFLLSIFLPHLMLSFAGLTGTVVFLILFAAAFSYLVAYYDNPDDFKKEVITSPLILDEDDTNQQSVIEQPGVGIAEPSVSNTTRAPESDVQITEQSDCGTVSDLDGDNQPIIEEDAAINKPISNSLDDLLDFAFQQKECANHQLALNTFQLAFNLYQDSDAGPQLAIEVAKLLMNQGAYDEAISILITSCKLPVLVLDSPLYQEITSLIAYITIVKNTLLKQDSDYTIPFNQISATISKEINAKFREWQNRII
ncbi:MAG: hypothetical protein H6Q74_324 [Firmicutes bacterium]|nr:hypothetical protein [Bacillota bacterium]